MKLISIANRAFLFLLFSLGSTQGKAFFTSRPLLIQSLESRTTEGQPVFNEITWFEFPDKDVWMMNQSHHGLSARESEKDRLVVVVDRTKKPFSAYFMQVASGPLVWSEDLYRQKKEFSVSCFRCHANGLRTIRRDPNGIKMGWGDFTRLNYFNFKILSYGRMVEDSRHQEEDLNLKVPFRIRSGHANDKLILKVCASCHDGENRSFLTRQQAGTIQFLVEARKMPPEDLNEKERKQIFRFINGF